MNRTRFLSFVAAAVSLLWIAGCQSDNGVRPDAGQVMSVQSEISGTTARGGDPRLFKGPAVPVGNGVARTWVQVDADGAPTAIGVDLSANALERLPDSATRYVLRFHPIVERTPWNHVLLDYNPEGHVPPGVYDLEHFDIHFYMTSIGEREAIGAEDPEHDILPDPIYIPVDYMKIPGGEPQMGAHWVDLQAPEFNGGVFSQTFIWGSYDGMVTFLEPMITMDLLRNGPYEEIATRQPQAFQHDGYYPTSYGVEKLGPHGGTRISMRGLTWHEGR